MTAVGLLTRHSSWDLDVDRAAPWTERVWAQPLAQETYRGEVWSRLVSNILVTVEGCWEWQRRRNEDGYGQISVKSRMVRAHQVALAISRGALWPEELQVDHLCRNRACCNPSHLELVTPAENTRRGLGPSSFVARLVAPKRAKTHCIKGHPFDERNTYVQRDGSRRCRRCRADGMRRQGARS